MPYYVPPGGTPWKPSIMEQFNQLGGQEIINRFAQLKESAKNREIEKSKVDLQAQQVSVETLKMIATVSADPNVDPAMKEPLIKGMIDHVAKIGLVSKDSADALYKAYTPNIVQELAKRAELAPVIGKLIPENIAEGLSPKDRTTFLTKRAKIIGDFTSGAINPDVFQGAADSLLNEYSGKGVSAEVGRAMSEADVSGIPARVQFRMGMEALKADIALKKAQAEHARAEASMATKMGSVGPHEDPAILKRAEAANDRAQKSWTSLTNIYDVIAKNTGNKAPGFMANLNNNSIGVTSEELNAFGGALLQGAVSESKSAAEEAVQNGTYTSAPFLELRKLDNGNYFVARGTITRKDGNLVVGYDEPVIGSSIARTETMSNDNKPADSSIVVAKGTPSTPGKTGAPLPKQDQGQEYNTEAEADNAEAYDSSAVGAAVANPPAGTTTQDTSGKTTSIPDSVSGVIEGAAPLNPATDDAAIRSGFTHIVAAPPAGATPTPSGFVRSINRRIYTFVKRPDGKYNVKVN